MLDPRDIRNEPDDLAEYEIRKPEQKCSESPIFEIAKVPENAPEHQLVHDRLKAPERVNPVAGFALDHTR